MKVIRSFPFCFGLISVRFVGVHSGSPPITASIQATWTEPPLLVQVLEAATLERPDSFFEFLDVVEASWPADPTELSTDQKSYKHIIETLRKLGLLDGPGEFESLEASIALKEVHPKLETFRAWSASNFKTEPKVSKVPEQKVFKSNGCESWVEIEGQKVCDPQRLEELFGSDHFDESFPDSTIFPFDHLQGSLSSKAKTAILYASDDPKSFGPFHKILSKASQSIAPRVKYVFRWHLQANSLSDQAPARLSGWAAGLDIKKSEYLTLDDRPVDSEDQAQENSKENDSDSDKIKDENTKLKPLKASEIADIGLKAAQHVLSSDKPLSALRKLTENFPQYAHSLVTEWVPEGISIDLQRELRQNLEEGMRPGRSALWINGLELHSLSQSESLNFFELMEIMRKERRWISDLKLLGFSPFESRRLITNESVNAAMNPESAVKSDGMMIDPSIMGERFDASDREEGGGAILWLNDLEKDERYSDWPSNLRNLLRPTFPGQLHAIARNMINVVIAVNLTNSASLEPLGEIVEPLLSRGLPIRWGIVPLLDLDKNPSDPIPKTFWNLTQSVGPLESLRFIKKFSESSQSGTVDPEKFCEDASEIIAAEASENEGEKDKKNSEKDYKTWLEKAQKYISRLNLCSSDGSVPACALINGRFFKMDEDFRGNLQQSASIQTQFLQHQVYFEQLSDDQSVADYLYDLPNVHPARNDFVFPSEGRPLRFVNLVEALSAFKSGPDKIFFENSAKPDPKNDALPKTMLWLAGDLDSDSGVAAVSAALELLARPSSKSSVQVAFVHVPSNMKHAGRSTAISQALEILMKSKSGSEISSEDLIKKLRSLGVLANDHKAVESVENSDAPVLRIVKPNLVDIGKEIKSESIWSNSPQFLQKHGLNTSELFVVANGRVLTVSQKQILKEADLRMLVEFETHKRSKPLIEALSDLKPKESIKWKLNLPLLVSVLGSVLVESEEPMQITSTQARSVAYNSRLGEHSSIALGNDKESLFEIGVILDPTSETAQRWSAFLEVLSKRSDVSIKIWLNPIHEVKELPIKRFFRTVFSNSLDFDESGKVIAPGASFRDIPSDVLLTLGIDTPPAWLALPKDSVHDLDNIMLSELPGHYRDVGVDAVMQLEHIIISGHARELPGGRPPRGLQLVLTDLLRGGEVDTIIMANLGYFQFKSTPGLHRISIRPGRSAELYALESLEAAESNALIAGVNSTQDNQQICLTTFNGVKLFPQFRKLPGKEDESLIQPINADSQPASAGSASELTKIMGQFKDIASGILRKSDVNQTSSDKVINIFTVASGLLYERMAYLMCVSVMRHTKSKVKFWFISNFLSPSFKRFIPHLAREYGFDYQLVTYRWPPWLRAQKEKQRVIWGYKILFLDVLFPLELERVIFVDSDQIVRTDLKDLVELDLRGAPYAYTPMCNDRNETKGFRFWDTGYWKDSLQGKPYHISALYVVDLRVFRAVAAGDQLRQHYQALSADPGSLANLDQDLPNNMQTILPIFSLDQSWLWCETWCSDEGLKTAKTIDLCNNPLTHEPKLKRARRLIPEWDVYDKEVAKLAEKVKRETKDEKETPINMNVGDEVLVDSKGGSKVQDGEEHTKDEL